MPKPETLASLKDIHLPPPTGWWPPAPGWVVLTLLLFLFACSLAYVISRHFKKGQAKREGLRLLSQCEKEYMNGTDSTLTSAKISELLKRVALAYFPRENVAGLQGEAWLAFLNKTGKNLDFHTVKNDLLFLPFKANSTSDLKPLLTLAKAWIKQRSAACSS